MRGSQKFCLGILLTLAVPALAQNHSHHPEAVGSSAELQQEQLTTTHSHGVDGTMAEDTPGMSMSAPAELRDPHAYSDGFERGSGPYALPGGQRVRLADETAFTGLWIDRLEYVESHDTDATEFEGHVWIGDSYNRFLLRSEFEVINDTLDVAEVDLLHSRAISPFWDLRLGLRHEARDEGHGHWASVGLAGLAPYWFEVDASLFLNENGNVLFDLETEYDLLLSQRLVFQPRLDIHAYSKTDTEMRQGAGLSQVKAGFRLRYEFDRQLAPYLGMERVLKYGRTAELLLPEENRSDTHWLLGLKFWF